jgi:hypothetical protein
MVLYQNASLATFRLGLKLVLQTLAITYSHLILSKTTSMHQIRLQSTTSSARSAGKNSDTKKNSDIKKPETKNSDTAVTPDLMASFAAKMYQVFTGASNINSTMMPWRSLPDSLNPQGRSDFSAASIINPTTPWQPDDPPYFSDDSNLDESNLDASPHGLPDRARDDRHIREIGTHLEKSTSKRKTPIPGYVNGPTLMGSTARDLAGGDATSRFTCPLQECLEKLPPKCTIRDLWSHCSDKRHRNGLFQQDHVICEVGCQQGFADQAHLLLHYTEWKCTNEQLPSTACPAPGYSWRPAAHHSVDRMRGNILTRYISKHAAAAHKDDNVQLKDHLCELGFPNKAFMFYRFVGGG